MIYVSSSCIKTKNIEEAVESLASEGILNIELSGGSSYDENIINTLVRLKERYKLNLMAHNYFPPPKEDFVLNLASLNDDIYHRSMEHYKKAIEVSMAIDSDSFGMHAGFYINISTDRLGKRIKKSELFNKEKARERFCKGFDELKILAQGVDLYIENNVFSYVNYQEYPESNPFMLTCYKEYKELSKMIDFNLLLDVAHLKVSAHTLELNFKNELKNMAKVSKYWHLSDNNNLADENKGFQEDMMQSLKDLPFRPKQATIEVYEDISIISKSYKEVKKNLF
jgi:sugar phosphate isomerase/epimerase